MNKRKALDRCYILCGKYFEPWKKREKKTVMTDRCCRGGPPATIKKEEEGTETHIIILQNEFIAPGWMYIYKT